MPQLMSRIKAWRAITSIFTIPLSQNLNVDIFKVLLYGIRFALAWRYYQSTKLGSEDKMRTRINCILSIREQKKENTQMRKGENNMNKDK